MVAGARTPTLTYPALEAALMLHSICDNNYQKLRINYKLIFLFFHTPTAFLYFERNENKTYTETEIKIDLIALLFVVDISGPSVPQELYATVPQTKIPFVSILL